MKTLNRVLVGVLTLASVLSLNACATRQNAYTGQEQVSGAATGAALGAIAGGTAGGVASGSTGAMAGAAAGGGVVGGTIGYFWSDKENEAARQKLQAAGVRVVEVGYSNDIILVMPSNVQFATGSSKINPKFNPILDAVAEVMNHYEYTVADVIGNADNIGSATYNLNLSLARAQNVADYIAAQGVSANRLVAKGYGEMHPVATNATTKGRIANRYVEIVLHAPPIK